jgi:malate permease and related proteins
VIGLVMKVTDVHLPDIIMTTGDLLGRCVAPLMMLSIGIALRPIRLRTLPLLAPAVIIKLCISPLIAYGVIVVIGPDARLAKAILLEAGMPTMMLTMVFAQKYGLDEALLAEAIVVSTVVSMVTLAFLAGSYG